MFPVLRLCNKEHLLPLTTSSTARQKAILGRGRSPLTLDARIPDRLHIVVGCQALRAAEFPENRLSEMPVRAIRGHWQDPHLRIFDDDHGERIVAPEFPWIKDHRRPPWLTFGQILARPTKIAARKRKALYYTAFGPQPPKG